MNAKERYDKKVKTTRVFLADYLMLKELAKIAGVSMSEALHQLITGQDHKTPVPAEQIRMPVNMAKSIPVTTAYHAEPVTAIATNGNKAIAFRIKPKGVKYD